MMDSVGKPQRGFTLQSLVVLLALVTVSTTVVLALVDDRVGLVGDEPRALETREVRRGGLLELLFAEEDSTTAESLAHDPHQNTR